MVRLTTDETKVDPRSTLSMAVKDRGNGGKNLVPLCRLEGGKRERTQGRDDADDEGDRSSLADHHNVHHAD